MSWRANSHEQDAQKEFLKLAKKLRDIKKLEDQKTPVEPNQQVKLAQKGSLLEEAAALADHLNQEWWEKNEDIYALLDAVSRSTVDAALAQKAAKQKQQEQAKQERIAAANSPSSARGPGRPATEMRKVPEIFANRHERPVTDLAYDDRHGLLYSSCKDKLIICWDCAGEDKLVAVATLCGHEGAVYCIDVVGERDELVSGGADGWLCWWSADPASGKVKPGGGKDKKEKIATPTRRFNYNHIIRGLRAHPEKGICLYTDKFPSAPPHLALLSYDEPSQVLWRTETMFENAKTHHITLNSVGGAKVFSCHEDGCVRVWGMPQEESQSSQEIKIPEPKLLKKMKLHEAAILTLNWHKHLLLTASTDMTVKAINTASRELPTVYTAKANRPLRAVAAYDFPEDKCFGFIYGGGRDPKDVTTSNLLPDEFEFYQSWFGAFNTTIQSRHASVGPLHRIMWLHGLGRVISAGEDGEVRMWDHESLAHYR